MASKSEPWNKSNPRKKAGKASKHLSSKKKSKAKSIARSHGRSKPSLVDNMNAGRSKKSSTKKSAAKKKKSATRKRATKKTAKRRSSRKTASKKRAVTRSGTATKSRTKDPRGGLTAAGRTAFARKDGSHLKPGVKTSGSAMTPQDMKRKGSWAVRFYGRHPLPPLVDKKGEPTRLALSAHAWGEPVPKTEAAARRIAAKGKKLLVKYEKTKKRSPKGD